MGETFKVIKIINAYSIVINGGSNNELHLGDEMEVFVKGEEILDPDTNESLGTLDYIKSRIEIATLLPKMSICKNYKVSAFIITLADSLSKKTEQALNIDSTEISGEYFTDSTKIKIGDTVRKLV